MSVPVFQAGRLPHYPFRGPLSVHSRYGLHAHRVACSDLLHRRPQPLWHQFQTGATLPGRSRSPSIAPIAPIATGWSDQPPGGNHTH